MPWEEIYMEISVWEEVKALCCKKNLSPDAFLHGSGKMLFRGGLPQNEFKVIMKEVEELRKKDKLEIHEQFRDLLPTLSGDQRKNLELDILEHGVREPIAIWGKFIVDGHNRYSICTEHKIPFETVSMDFDNILEAKIWIMRNQIGRRNLSVNQRAELSVSYLALMEKQKRSAPAGMNHTTDRNRKVAAEAFGVGEETVAKMKRVKESADEELKKAVESGDLSLHAANKELQEKAKVEKESKTFNRTNDKIAWSKWTWNPQTGCWGPGGTAEKPNRCEYCYAYDMAMRFKLNFNDFVPTFHPDRLSAPFNTSIPELDKDLPGIHNVFLGSMGELAQADKKDFAEIMKTVRRCEKENTRKKPKIPPWNFIVLTKDPEWLESIDWPSNVWVGITVDTQERVRPAVEAMSRIEATVKFFSVEPLVVRVDFLLSLADVGEAKAITVGGKVKINGLQFVDWVVIGGRSKSSNLPAAQPKWEYVEAVFMEARAAGCKIYFKPNLTVTPLEYPEIEGCCSNFDKALEIAKAKGEESQ